MKKPPVRETTPLFGSLRYWEREKARIFDKEELTPLDNIRLANCDKMIKILKSKEEFNAKSSSKP